MKNLYDGGRKLSFDNVVNKLRGSHYLITCPDYANGGIDLFQERKFADNLGVSVDYLFGIGLLKKSDKWKYGYVITLKPNYEELIKLRNKLS